MKRTALPLLFALLSGVLCLGRSASGGDAAPAIKGVRRLRESLGESDSLQVSRAVITNRGVCLEYRRRQGSRGASMGFAVYKADKDLVYVDNSWIWDQVCLTGKIGQRRDGKDVTEAVGAALGEEQPVAPRPQPASSAPPAAAVAIATAPAAQSATPRALVETVALTSKVPVATVTTRPVAPAQTTCEAPPAVAKSAIAREAVSVVAPTPVAASRADQPADPARVETVVLTVKAPVATIAPVPSAPIQAVPAAAPVRSIKFTPTADPAIAPVSAATAPVAPATPVAMPVEISAPAAQAKVVVDVTPAHAPEVQPSPAASAPPAPVRLPSSYAVSAAPVASLEIGTIRGVTIVDNNGALERKGPPPTPESLGDAARRLKKSKQQ